MKDEQKVFLQILRNTMEDFAFMFSEENEVASFSEWNECAIHVSIMFSGTSNAAITLTAPESLCAEMAANILGTEPDNIDFEDRADALQELSNVVCGRLIPELFGNKKMFDLTTPCSVRINESEWTKMASDKSSFKLRVEGRPMFAKLAITIKV